MAEPVEQVNPWLELAKRAMGIGTMASKSEEQVPVMTNQREDVANMVASTKKKADKVSPKKPSFADIKPVVKPVKEEPFISGNKEKGWTALGTTDKTTTVENTLDPATFETTMKPFEAANKAARKSNIEAKKAAGSVRDTATSEAYKKYKTDVEGAKTGAKEEYAKHGEAAMWDRVIDSIGKMVGAGVGLYRDKGEDIAGAMKSPYAPIYDKEAADLQTQENLKGTTDLAKTRMDLSSKQAEDNFKAAIEDLYPGIDLKSIYPEVMKLLGTKVTTEGARTKEGKPPTGGDTNVNVHNNPVVNENINKNNEIISKYKADNAKLLEKINTSDATTNPPSLAKLTSVVSGTPFSGRQIKIWNDLKKNNPEISDEEAYNMSVDEIRDILNATYATPDSMGDTPENKKWKYAGPQGVQKSYKEVLPIKDSSKETPWIKPTEAVNTTDKYLDMHRNPTTGKLQGRINPNYKAQ